MAQPKQCRSAANWFLLRTAWLALHIPGKPPGVRRRTRDYLTLSRNAGRLRNKNE
jgi:hypothetical protein